MTKHWKVSFPEGKKFIKASFECFILWRDSATSMKSLKNHISLIIALFTVLASVQIYVSIDRTIAAYESHLKDDYSVIVVTNKAFTDSEIKTMSSMIARSEPINKPRIDLSQTVNAPVYEPQTQSV